MHIIFQRTHTHNTYTHTTHTTTHTRHARSPVLTHAKNRALREEMYRAYAARASAGDGDNTPIIDSVLSLRAEKAKLLGFDTFADLSMASKVRGGQSVPCLCGLCVCVCVCVCVCACKGGSVFV